MILTFGVIVIKILVKWVIKGKFTPEGGQKGTPGTPAVPPLSEELVSQVYEDIQVRRLAGALARHTGQEDTSHHITGTSSR